MFKACALFLTLALALAVVSGDQAKMSKCLGLVSAEVLDELSRCILDSTPPSHHLNRSTRSQNDFFARSLRSLCPGGRAGCSHLASRVRREERPMDFFSRSLRSDDEAARFSRLVRGAPSDEEYVSRVM